MTPPLPPEDMAHIFQQTQSLWEELRDKQIFITGGTGFFGRWLLESFLFANTSLNLGAKAVVLTRSPAVFTKKAPHLIDNPAVEFFTGEIESFSFPKGDFSHVVHAGASFGATVSPLETLDTIIRGTRRTLDFAVAAGAKKFLLVSSGGVYAKQPSDMDRIPETWAGAPDPGDPQSTYGESKRVAELLGRIYSRQYGIEVKVARCFSFLGPHLPLDAHFAIGNFIRDACNGSPIRVHGDGSPIRSYLYAADLATWLWTILFIGKNGQPYNVGSEIAVSVADVAQIVGSALELQIPVQIAGSHDPSRTTDRYIPCCDRARTLGLSESFPLKEQILKTLAWHRCHPGHLDSPR